MDLQHLMQEWNLAPNLTSQEWLSKREGSQLDLSDTSLESKSVTRDLHNSFYSSPK